MIGDEDHVAEGPRQYAEAGATEIVLTAHHDLDAATRSRTRRSAGDLAKDAPRTDDRLSCQVLPAAGRTRPQHVQQRQRLGVTRSGRCAVEHQVLVAVREREGVAVDGDVPEERVPEGLREHRRRLHVVAFPEPREIGAPVAQLVDETGHRGIGWIAREGGPELQDDVMPELGDVGDPVQLLLLEERAAREVAVVWGELAEVLHEGGREVVAREHLERRGHDETRRLRQPFEQRENARPHVAPVPGVADAVAVDLADRASIRAAVDQVENLHGRLDGAFNNSAVVQQPGPLDTTSDESIDEQFAVNFRGHWTAMTAEAALMRRNGGGAIVNTSSIGSRRANPALPAYGAMKRALDSLTETAAVTWAKEGIRVNGITPGGTATAMIDEWEAATPGIVARITATSPLGRMANPARSPRWRRGC